ncbi:MAG: response regulator [Thermodesulfobacteriota bacterium]
MARILIVDDSPSDRSALRNVLESRGYRVQEASDGKAAIRMQRTTPADLVITEILLPEKDGMETIVDLKRGFPDVKVIAVSRGGAISPQIYLKMAMELGASRALRKPFDPHKMTETVWELVG